MHACWTGQWCCGSRGGFGEIVPGTIKVIAVGLVKMEMAYGWESVPVVEDKLVTACADWSREQT